VAAGRRTADEVATRKGASSGGGRWRLRLDSIAIFFFRCFVGEEGFYGSIAIFFRSIVGEEDVSGIAWLFLGGGIAIFCCSRVVGEADFCNGTAILFCRIVGGDFYGLASF